MTRFRLFTALFALITTGSMTTQVAGQRRGQNTEDPAAKLTDSAMVHTVAARSVGPAVMSGRVVDIAVAESPGSRGGRLGTVLYIAAATGGVWKSTNGGVSWRPVFDEAGVGSMGDVTVAPSNSEIVWVGTGEPNNMRSSSYGDGVYKSTNGGATWEHMGLRTSQHVGRILVHPEDPDVVWVAAVGPLWGPGGERGVFKTIDGGATWSNTLTIDKHTGVTDLAMHPAHPDIIYAAALQRERRAYSYVGGGPGSGIYKSIDGGETWRELREGLPTSDMGRIGLDISRSQPRTLYAVIEGSEAGVYRSDNHGATWTKTSDIASIPWYFGQIRVDPNDPEVVYHLGQRLQRSRDGGITFDRIADEVHVDHHALWINPENSDHLVLGNDGGLYVSHDFGATWDFSPDLPISQFYAVGLDTREPFYYVYGGTQDNSTWGGPSRNRQQAGVGNADWFRMAGGDGFYAAIDPVDPNVAYVESQNGNIVRFDGRTGERKSIRPIPPDGEEPYRYNWSAPIKISPHDPSTVYFAGNYLFKSTNRGDRWERLGEDLTRAIDRDSLPMMGGIPDRDAVSRHQGTAVFGNISDIDISPVRAGLFVTGSDDGVVAVSRDDGQTWNKVTRFPGVPDTTYVSKVRWSRHDEGTIYATMDGHRSNDFRPYVLKSTDYGDSWRSIAANLPAFGSVRAFAEHPRDPNLLFVGTEIAPFVSMDGGASWVRLRHGIPPSPVHDIAIHARDNALVVATHGRGFYVIDDLTPFQYIARAKQSDRAFLMPVTAALAFVEDISGTTGTHASRNYRAPNPPVGTRITYLVREKPPETPTLEILGPSGDVVRRLDAEDSAGLHHAWWDLTTEPPYTGPAPARSQGGFGPSTPASGPMVLPGRYIARLTVEGGEDHAPLVFQESFEVIRDPVILLSEAELQTLFETRARVARTNASFRLTLRGAEQVKEQITDAKAAIEAVAASDALSAVADSLEETIDDILVKLRGRPRRPGGGGGDDDDDDDDGPRPIQQRLNVASGVFRATALPTTMELEALDSIGPHLRQEADRINVLLDTRLPEFFRALDAAGVPWSLGRRVRVN